MKRDVRIRTKVMVFSMAAVFLVAAVLVGMIQMSKSKLSGQVGDELEIIAREEIGGIAHDVWLMCLTAHETMKGQLELALDAAGRLEREQGGVSFSGPVQSWQAKNQFSDVVTAVSLPGALVGQTPLGQNSDLATPTPLVDRIQAMTGTTATVFQRMNAQGDMLRVATNVKAKDGRRAIGTYIPAVGADGTPNAVVQKVLGGETFIGRAFVVDDWYLTAYRPLKGPEGTVDGMLYVGVRQSSLTALREAIMNRGVGKDGYVYVLGGKGAQQGLYIISSGGKRDGENIWEAKDADGKLFIQELINKGLATEDGAFDYHRYNWSNKQGEKPQPKVAAITYFAPWDWVIGAGAYESDFLAPQQRVDKQLAAVGMWGAVLGLVLLAMCGVGTYLITRGIDRGLQGVSRQFAELASGVQAGNLDVRADVAAVDVDFRGVVKSANEIIDAFVPPIRATAAAVDGISRGAVPEKLASGCQGEFKVVEDNLNRCIDAVNALVTDANTLAAAAVEGHLATRADASRHQGDFRHVIEGVNATLDAVIGPLSVAAGYIDRIAKGDTPPKITDEYKGDFAAVRDNLNTCVDTLHALVDEVGAIVRAGRDGQLSSRANADRLAGVWRKILRGCNEALDAVITPLNVAAFNVDRIAKGDIPPKITDEYKGDFNTIKNNLNTCIDAINALIADGNRLAEAAVAGQLDTRADASRHEGDYRKIIDGINQTLDAVVTPIQEAAKVLERLAEYDLRARMHGEYRGDHAKIKASLNQTAQALHDALAQVAEAVDQVSSASQQIASSSQQVAEGSSEQASSLEETSSSLEEMASMTKQNADNTQQAKALTDATRGAADRGTAAMSQMVAAMGKIRTASEGTAQIIRDINEIAFQTNLLALNAAVEAARAGDAGRGFAVVAEEVRNLAQRAKEAAKKTEDLIHESVTLSEGGEKISREVGENLEGILASVNKVSEIMNEVATASQEQSRGIEQVNAAVAEMDKVVQAAAASAEESSSASEELASQAQELAAMVGRFQLQGQEKRPAGGGGSARRSAPVKPPKGSRPSKPAGRAPTSGGPSGWQLKPEDIIPLEDELTLSKF